MIKRCFIALMLSVLTACAEWDTPARQVTIQTNGYVNVKTWRAGGYSTQAKPIGTNTVQDLMNWIDHNWITDSVTHTEYDAFTNALNTNDLMYASQFTNLFPNVDTNGLSSTNSYVTDVLAGSGIVVARSNGVVVVGTTGPEYLYTTVPIFQASGGIRAYIAAAAGTAVNYTITNMTVNLIDTNYIRSYDPASGYVTFTATTPGVYLVSFIALAPLVSSVVTTPATDGAELNLMIDGQNFWVSGAYSYPSEFYCNMNLTWSGVVANPGGVMYPYISFQHTPARYVVGGAMSIFRFQAGGGP